MADEAMMTTGVTAPDPAAKLYDQAELDAAIDRDRIEGFMIFVRALSPSFNGSVFGTTNQARAIMRALEKLGY